MKVKIVYWSGTGNTEAMANAIAEGASGAGAEVEISSVDGASEALDCDVLILGCPAMGSESLEESEFEPYYSAIKDKLKGKKLALFGSYDWGDGEWLRTWQEDAESVGAVMIAEGLAVNNTPDEEGLLLCKELGVKAAA